MMSYSYQQQVNPDLRLEQINIQTFLHENVLEIVFCQAMSWRLS